MKLTQAKKVNMLNPMNPIIIHYPKRIGFNVLNAKNGCTKHYIMKFAMYAKELTKAKESKIKKRARRHK